jgi:hypothetical protein
MICMIKMGPDAFLAGNGWGFRPADHAGHEYCLVSLLSYHTNPHLACPHDRDLHADWSILLSECVIW